MIINSELSPLATPVVLELAKYNLFKIHIGIRFYNIVGGNPVEVEPTAGDVEVSIGKPTIRGLKPIGVIAANDPTADLSFAGPVVTAKVAQQVAVVGATHFKVVIATEQS